MQKKELITYCIFLLPFYGRAQLVSREVVDKYPPSVISRVYEVTFVSLVSESTQIRLADYFLKKDSMIVTAAKDGTSLKTLKTRIDSLQIEFENILNPEEKFKYNFFKYQNFFEADAKMEAAYVKQKYSANEDVVNSIQKLNLSKNQRVLKAIVSNASLTSLPDSTFLYYHNNDSILNKYLIAAEGEKYFNSKVNELIKIKPLSPKDKDELTKNFRIQCLKNGRNYHKNFNTAMQVSIAEPAYYKALYQDSLKEVSKVIAQKELERYVYKYSLNDEARNKIAPIILDKASKSVWLDTRYQFNRKRDSLQTEIDETSWAEIKNELVRIGYTQLDKGRFVDAIRFKNILHLTKTQIDTLLNANLVNDLMISTYKSTNKGASPDLKWYVTEQLRSILTEGQYDTLLLIQVQPQAIANAKQNWVELKKFKLTDGIDSLSSIRSIIAYHMSLLALSERYYNDWATYSKLAKTTRQTKPEILKRLEAAKKEDEKEEKQQ